MKLVRDEGIEMTELIDKRLTLAAEGRGIPVIPGSLHEADLREYAEEELLPQLRTLGIC